MLLIETIVVGEAQHYAQITLPQLWKFAHDVSADFRVRHNFVPQSGTPSMKADSPSWEKVNVIKEFAVQSRYSTLLILDADILPHPNAAKRVLALLNELRDGTMAAVLEKPESEPEKWAAYYLKWYKDFHGTEDKPSPDYFNGGMMFITRGYAQKWATQMPDKYMEWFMEQHYLNATAPRSVQCLSVDFNWCLRKPPTDSVVFAHAYNTEKMITLQRLALAWANV